MDGIKLQLDGEVPQGTKFVRAAVIYDECLADWLAGDGAVCQADAVEGGALHEEWHKRMCDREIYGDQLVDCSVASATTTYNSRGDSHFATMSVTYDLRSGGGELFVVGPFPTDAGPDCEPTVEVGGLMGFDGADNGLWSATAVDGTVAVGQDAPVVMQLD